MSTTAIATEKKIAYHLPHRATNERAYILDYHDNHFHVAEGGMYTQKCIDLIKARTGAAHVFMTSSCTGAMQTLAYAQDIGPGDEVIVPALGISSTALVHTNQGASITFVDIDPKTWNIDVDLLEEAITSKTKAIAVMHYQGIACDMDRIRALAKKHNLVILEDAAQCAMSFHNGTHVGAIENGGAAFSTHATKNEASGLGGYIILPDDSLLETVETIYDKGTGRQAFRRGVLSSFHWDSLVGMGATMAEENAARLAAQLEDGQYIRDTRMANVAKMDERLRDLIEEGRIARPITPDFADPNGHMYAVTLDTMEQRNAAIKYLGQKGIGTTFHFLDQATEPATELLKQENRYRFITKDGTNHSKKISDTMIRLPIHTHLTDEDIERVGTELENFLDEYEG